MKRLIVLLSIALLPLMLSAEHFYVWNKDPLDRFYDSQVGDSVDCAYWVEYYLSANGHTYHTGTTLPSNLNSYDAVFCLLGWFRC